VNSLGWALFCNTTLLQFGTIKGLGPSLSHEKRIEYIIDSLYVTVTNAMSVSVPASALIDTVVIEKPKLWGAVKSVASQHSGSLLGLHILVGALYWWGRSFAVKAEFIPVSDWKGQLPKDVTTRRTEKKYNITTSTHDEADAIGIGDYFVNHTPER
jgi:hypothetical protein